MNEISLEVLRRQIRDAETRLNDSVPDESYPTPVPDSKAEVGQEPQTRSTEKLRLLQRSFRALLQATTDAFVLVDSDGGWELANGHVPEWLGYTPEEFQQIQLTEVFEPEDVKTLLESFPQWFEGTHPLVKVSMGLRGKNGAQVPVLISSYSWQEDNGQIAYLVLEDARPKQQFQAQVSALHSFLDTAMRSGPIPMALLQPDGAIVEINSVACQRLGVDAKAVKGSPLQDFVSDSSKDDFSESLSRALSMEPTSNIMLRLSPLDKTSLTVHASFVGIVDSEGMVSHICCGLNHEPLEVANRDSGVRSDTYGRMAPQLLKELDYLISASARDFSDQLKEVSVPPSLVLTTTKLLDCLDRVRDTLTSWAESADYLHRSPAAGTLQQLLKDVVTTRRPEMQRWGIEPNVEFKGIHLGEILCPPAVYPAVLHILQSCIEEIRECREGTALTVRVSSSSGERLEISFIYELPRLTRDLSRDGTSTVFEHLRFKNIELRAARMLLDSIGGTLVLENVTETQRAIRLSLGLPLHGSYSS